MGEPPNKPPELGDTDDTNRPVASANPFGSALPSAGKYTVGKTGACGASPGGARVSTHVMLPMKPFEAVGSSNDVTLQTRVPNDTVGSPFAEVGQFAIDIDITLVRAVDANNGSRFVNSGVKSSEYENDDAETPLTTSVNDIGSGLGVGVIDSVGVGVVEYPNV